MENLESILMLKLNDELIFRFSKIDLPSNTFLKKNLYSFLGGDCLLYFYKLSMHLDAFLKGGNTFRFLLISHFVIAMNISTMIIFILYSHITKYKQMSKTFVFYSVSYFPGNVSS